MICEMCARSGQLDSCQLARTYSNLWSVANRHWGQSGDACSAAHFEEASSSKQELQWDHSLSQMESEKIEQTLYQCRNVQVYRIPPRPSSGTGACKRDHMYQ